MILAVSTERSIGLVIAVLIGLATAIYILVNVFRSGRAEVGAEIELAPNRKPYYDDDELETKRLDLAMLGGVATLAVIALALPLYWLGEPGRQEGRDDFETLRQTNRGADMYEEFCSGCHGPEGTGGVAPFTVADDEGRFIFNASETGGWRAPALNTVLKRFSEDEVRWVLNFGRAQSPMPAWGTPGGGPMTTQQIDDLIFYMRSIQLDPVDEDGEPITDERNGEVTEGQTAMEIQEGLREAVRERAVAEDAAVAQADAAVTDLANSEDITAVQEARATLAAELDRFIAELGPEERGELLFDNPAGAGAYACARCHTAGASWNADEILDLRPDLLGLVEPENPGCGGFGPSLCDGVTLRQFDTAAAHEAFITEGCVEGQAYGNNGVCDGGGQMPGFGQMLSAEQIADIVAYERSL